MGKARLLRVPDAFGSEISWSSTVAEFSKREVTFERDRLPALAGLAARYREVTGYTYLAGLWLEEMPLSLMWRPVPRTLHNQQGLANHGAPSWSWASFNKTVHSPHSSVVQKFAARSCIASFCCRYNPPDSISTIEEAWIDIGGRAAVVTERRDHKIKAGDTWWYSTPDNGDRYPEKAIAQANVYLLILGSVGRSDGLISYGSLVLQGCGLNDGHPCVRRLGVARLSRREAEQSPPPGSDPSWQQRVIRLI
ncbi:hypothetical protein N8I77_003521 [Diaporthe amygdali]|uniref:Uncharacterized protein n=1 Tax=Phomopsis amygdali TaxID=1214568 RepID=A0AAD9SKK1_PHOAM|nr:hypothetical protein N8I77_003521 [Diaporthe amygdali]